MTQYVKRFIPLLVAILLLGYALRGVAIQEILDQFKQANGRFITLSGFSLLVFYVLRGMRWKQPLLALGYQPTTLKATMALLTGTIASLIIPGAGELTRCATLRRTDGVPITHSIGSIVAERMVDLFMLVILLALTLLVEFNKVSLYVAQLTDKVAIPINNKWMIAIIFVGLISLVVLLQIIRLPFVSKHRYYKKITGLLQGLWQGFAVIRNLPNPGLFVLLTLLIQITAWMSTYLLLLSVTTDKALTPTIALMILTAGSIGGLAVPTQAGIGTYHFFVSRALMLYDFSASEGGVIATYMHAVGFATSLLLSSISFLIIPFLVTKQPKEPAGES